MILSDDEERNQIYSFFLKSRNKKLELAEIILYSVLRIISEKRDFFRMHPNVKSKLEKVNLELLSCLQASASGRGTFRH